MTRAEGAQNDARPGAAGRASHQQKPKELGGSTLVGDTVAPARLERNAASSRIDPDTRGVQWTVVGLVGLLGLTSFLVLIAILIFFTTAADSATNVMGSMSQSGRSNPSTPVTIMWGLALGLVSMFLLLAGGSGRPPPQTTQHISLRRAERQK